MTRIWGPDQGDDDFGSIYRAVRDEQLHDDVPEQEDCGTATIMLPASTVPAVARRRFITDDESVYERIPADEFANFDDVDSRNIVERGAPHTIPRGAAIVTSQNGWSANDRSVIATFTVPGTTRKLALRAGDVSVVLLDVAAWIHKNIRPIDVGTLDDWGYAERVIRGSTTTLSNHASGTAEDLDALLHPLGVRGTWTAAETAKIRARLALYDGVVRWGEDYTGRPDGMHFEINKGAAAVKVVADKIRVGKLGPVTPPAPVPPASKTKDLSDMPMFDWPAGLGQKKIVCPVGKASALVAQAWMSMSCDGDIKSYDVWFQGDTGGISEKHGAAKPNQRILLDVPDGTTQITVHYISTGPIGATIELKAR